MLDNNVIWAEKFTKLVSLDERVSLDRIIKLARLSKNRRARICFHRTVENPGQLMLIAAMRDSVVPIHKHTAGREYYFPLLGNFTLLTYNENEELTKSIVCEPISLSNFLNNESFFCAPNKTWHKLEFGSDICIYLEYKPFSFSGDEEILLNAY